MCVKVGGTAAQCIETATACLYLSRGSVCRSIHHFPVNLVKTHSAAPVHNRMRMKRMRNLTVKFNAFECDKTRQATTSTRHGLSDENNSNREGHFTFTKVTTHKQLLSECWKLRRSHFPSCRFDFIVNFVCNSHVLNSAIVFVAAARRYGACDEYASTANISAMNCRHSLNSNIRP